MRSEKTIKYLLWLALLIVGYLAGAYLHPKFAKLQKKEQSINIDVEYLMSQPLVDISSGAPVSCDTLFSHERNLLVFWTPTCKFCRQFFQSRPNAYEVGVFCFPLTSDMDYTNYFLEQREIEYPNFGSIDSVGIIPVDMPSVRAVPTFVVLDGEGDVIEQKIGIDGIDSLLDNLYKR